MMFTMPNSGPGPHAPKRAAAASQSTIHHVQLSESLAPSNSTTTSHIIGRGARSQRRCMATLSQSDHL